MAIPLILMTPALSTLTGRSRTTTAASLSGLSTPAHTRKNVVHTTNHLSFGAPGDAAHTGWSTESDLPVAVGALNGKTYL